MNHAFKRALSFAVAVFGIFFLLSVPAQAQTEQPEKPPMADATFKNIQVLRGLSVDQFMGTMGFMASALSLNCSGCHDTTSAETYATDNDKKQMARRMMIMVDTFNKTNFGGKREITCYTCHRGSSKPATNVSLVEQYSAPPEDDPNEVELLDKPAPNTPSADQILNRYIQALGGAQKLGALKSFVARGSYEGFDTSHDKVTVEIFAQSPNRRTTLVHLHTGENLRVYDGINGWNNSTGTLLPIPVRALGGSDLEGARIEAAIAFPVQLKSVLNNWRSGFPATTINDKPVDVIQASGVDTTPVKFYFDKETGLLVRYTRYSDTPIGTIPSQVDFGDYHDVGGIKFPYKITQTWTDGQVFIELNDVRANATVEASRFARPQTAGR